MADSRQIEFELYYRTGDSGGMQKTLELTIPEDITLTEFKKRSDLEKILKGVKVKIFYNHDGMILEDNDVYTQVSRNKLRPEIILPRSPGLYIDFVGYKSATKIRAIQTQIESSLQTKFHI